MFTKLLPRKLRRANKPTVAKPRPRFFPRFDELEQRLTPSSVPTGYPFASSNPLTSRAG